MTWILAIACVILFLLTLYYRSGRNTAEKLCEKQKEEIQSLSELKPELDELKRKNKVWEATKSNLTAIPYMSAIITDFETRGIELDARLTFGNTTRDRERSRYIREIKQESQVLIQKNYECKYQLNYLLSMYPQLREVLENDYTNFINEHHFFNFEKEFDMDLYDESERKRYNLSCEILTLKREIKDVKAERDNLSELFNELKKQLVDSFGSNLTAIPYMASIMADFETYSLDILAQKLDWGRSQERAKKVKSIREIRKDAQDMVEKNLEAKYQLEYLLNLFPNLRDVIETDYNDLPMINATLITEYDRTRDWLSKEEYKNLGSIERNQLALDRYKESHNKTKWQIGRDYELYVGYRYSQKGYSINYFGSYMGMEDLGRDLIAKKDDTILIIQCKYWSQIKTIHEKHINQLYGTMICYCIENKISAEHVKGILITNITLSDTAKKMADYLHIEYVENYEKGDYPCIKCNIGHDENGRSTRIYHLPFDQQYDATKIDSPGEFYAMTVKEAEDAGFRRTYKWHGQ